MSEPIILSDEEDQNALSTPFQPFRCKKRRTQLDPNPIPTVLVLDDDPTPQKQPGPTSTPDFVPETPMSDLAIVKCTKAPSHFQARVSDSEHKFPGWLICVISPIWVLLEILICYILFLFELIIYALLVCLYHQYCSSVYWISCLVFCFKLFVCAY